MAGLTEVDQSLAFRGWPMACLQWLTKGWLTYRLASIEAGFQRLTSWLTEVGQWLAYRDRSTAGLHTVEVGQ